MEAAAAAVPRDPGVCGVCAGHRGAGRGAQSGPLGLGDAIGVLIAVVAIVGEAISDGQLSAFKRDPANKGKVCDTGLWALSRHPNYFFEWLHWLAYVAIGVSFAGYGWGFATRARAADDVLAVAPRLGCAAA